MDGGHLTLVDVREKVSLKPNTYKKYAFFMRKLIEDLNQKF